MKKKMNTNVIHHQLFKGKNNMPIQNVDISTDEILHMLNDVKNVQLKAVMMIKEPINVTKKLPIKSIIDKEYDSGKKIYWNFRRLVPFGRYSLAIGSYTDDGKEDSMMIMDTRLIKKVLKKEKI